MLYKMLHLFTGTDTAKVRGKLNAATRKVKGAETVRITDAHTLLDLEAALRGNGMFGARVVVLDNCMANEEMKELLLARLPELKDRDDTTFIYESAPDVATKKTLQKYAEQTEVFDAPKKERKDDFFAVVNALQRGQKKDLWVLLQKEFVAGKAPEAVHGSLFWAAKQMILKPRGTADAARGRAMVAQLAELPHEARRNGFELEYALEHFVLSSA